MKNYDKSRQLLRTAGYIRSDRAGSILKPGCKRKHMSIPIELWLFPDSCGNIIWSGSYKNAWKRYIKQKEKNMTNKVQNLADKVVSIFDEAQEELDPNEMEELLDIVEAEIDTYR
jgi:hypothetical protein